jgi:hypothetical protein
MPFDPMVFFCDMNSARSPHFAAPWVCDGWRYATDGRIVIRRPTYENEVPREHFPSCSVPKVFDGFPACEHAITFSDEKQEVKCEACRGVGMMTETCGTCEGSGNHVCVCGRRHKCGVCGGKGYTKKVPHEECPVCLGKRRLAFPADQFIFGNLFSGIYLGRIIKYLPAPCLHSRSRTPQQIARDGLPFVAGCYQGILMPLSRG